MRWCQIKNKILKEKKMSIESWERQRHRGRGFLLHFELGCLLVQSLGVFNWLIGREIPESLLFKVRSHGAICSRTTSVLYMHFCEIVHMVMVQWVWMQFVMYLHWNGTSQLHRIGLEPIHMWHRTQVCMVRRANRILWTVSLTTTQSNCCILKNRSRTSYRVNKPLQSVCFI